MFKEAVPYDPTQIAKKKLKQPKKKINAISSWRQKKITFALTDCTLIVQKHRDKLFLIYKPKQKEKEENSTFGVYNAGLMIKALENDGM